ncbi:MAG TPA: transcription termination/antitermination NusG family protein [Anaerolineales bacterium]|nr:transcription termination/antitermination NusG family protein [Anaerolineales bacterium]
MSQQWYVVRSKPNKELALWRELTARGLESFYPQLRVRPVNPRSRRVRPYFPGYLFLHADIELVGTSALQWTPFSSGLVAFDGLPAIVPDSLVQAIRRHVDEINAAGGEQFVDLKPGDTVLIQGGPFDGYEAIFDTRLAGTERVRILLKLLRVRQINLELPAAQIQRLERKKR